MSRKSDLITSRLTALVSEWTPPALAERPAQPAGLAVLGGLRKHLAGGSEWAAPAGSEATFGDPFEHGFDDGFDDFPELAPADHSVAPERPSARARGSTEAAHRGEASGQQLPAGPVAGGPGRLTAPVTRAVAIVVIGLLLGSAVLAVWRLRASPSEAGLSQVTVGGVPSVSVAASSQPVEAGAGTAGAGQTAGPTPADSVALVVVHVVGKVRDPGLVELPAGARVADALRAAGGLRKGAKLGTTNLAEVVSDGQRVEIGGSAPAAAAGSAVAGAAGAGPEQVVNLNSATVDQLDTLPGIGPVTAGKILAWREANGRFSTVEELAEVPGIGPKTLAELRPRVRV